MSVTAEITPSRSPLVQLTELDPQVMFAFSGTASGDGTGNFLQVTLNCPVDFSVVWFLLGGFVSGVTSSEVQYNVNLNALGTLFRASKPGRPVDGSLILEPFVPPVIMLNPQLAGDFSSANVIVDNVNLEDLTVDALAFGWDAQVGRNIPQRFFWPATLA